MTGPTVSVTLDDAPSSVAANGVDADLLVVHQQDIQAVVNALWSGGAEAMTIQGQRVISTTGIKCVGNTVVLHGVPYAPPYVISAIGDQDRLEAALDHLRPGRDLPPVRGRVRARLRRGPRRGGHVPGPRGFVGPPARPHPGRLRDPALTPPGPVHPRLPALPLSDSESGHFGADLSP